MVPARLKREIANVYQRLIRAREKLAKPCDQEESHPHGRKRYSWRPQLFAYHAIGKGTDRLLPLFRDMDRAVHRSGMKASFKPYVSLTILTSLTVAFSLMLVTPIALSLAVGLPLISSLLFGLGFGLLAGAITMIGFYIYPLYKADVMKRDLDNSLAFTAGYMAIMAGAGVPPALIFRSFANVPQKLAAIRESKKITRDVELFGTDIITALGSASDRTPSRAFRELLEGLISTIHTGGNLATYLVNRSRQYMKMRRTAMRKFSDTLGVLSEFYVTMLVAGPLIFVVMLAVMAMLGGGGIGVLSPTLLLTVLTYIGIPFGSAVFILILDALTPGW